MIKLTLQRVVECIATTTRYPTELLTNDADLENDLGIDSVKRLEIVVALGEEFGIALDAEDRDPSIRTIGDVSNWIDGFLRPPQPPEATNVQKLPPEIESRSRMGPTQRYDQALPSSVQPPHFTPPERPDSQPALTNTSGSKPLNGKIALVTGSGRGVGCTIARVLAARGATVVVNSFHSRDEGERTTEEINAQGGNAVHLWGSVANSEHVEQIFSRIEHQFGKLDMLVCNASDGRIGPFLDLGPDDWERAFRTNVVGHHQCAIRASNLMRLRGGGSIVTMSAVGSNGFIDGLGTQGVVKAAVETLTRYLACELGQYGIRSNCVVGGPVYGELLSKFPDSESAQNHWESMTPDGQLCSPLDLANAIAFLVSDDAKGINGSIWNVDHGFTATADGRPMSRAIQEKVPAVWS